MIIYDNDDDVCIAFIHCCEEKPLGFLHYTENIVSNNCTQTQNHITFLKKENILEWLRVKPVFFLASFATIYKRNLDKFNIIMVACVYTYLFSFCFPGNMIIIMHVIKISACV